MSQQIDGHEPKPLRDLVWREASGVTSTIVASLRLRVMALTRASYIHPRASLKAARGIEVGAHCQVYSGVTLSGRGSRRPALKLGRYVIVRENAHIDAHGGWIELEEGSFAGQNVVIYGQGGVRVGDNTLLSPGVSIFSAEHEFNRHDIPIKFQPERFAPVHIGRDCWIGANTVILAGVTIGNGTAVGAGSVVTRDLPEMSVAHGSPARVSRRR